MTQNSAAAIVLPTSGDSRGTEHLLALALALRPTRTLHLLAAYVAVPLLLGWFAYVFASGLPAVTPQRISMPTTSSYEPSMDDFAVFYAAGDIVRTGRADLYDLAAIRSEEARTASASEHELVTLPFYSPPFAALPFSFLSTLPPAAAGMTWTAAGLTVFAACWWSFLRGRALAAAFTVVFTAGVIASPPFMQVLIHGQTTFFLLAGFVLLWRYAFAGRNTAGAAAGLLLIADKPQLLPLPILFLLLGGQWKPLMGAAAAALAATAAVVLVAGPAIAWGYVHLSLQALHWDDQNGISTWGMFGWNAFSRALWGKAGGPRLLLTLALDVVTVAAVTWGARRRALSPRETIALVVFGGLLISPHVYQHDVLLAALPVLLFCSAGDHTSRTWIAFALVGWAVLYFHFDILTATRINATALWLASGIVLVLMSTQERHRDGSDGASRPFRAVLRA